MNFEQKGQKMTAAIVGGVVTLVLGIAGLIVRSRCKKRDRCACRAEVENEMAREAAERSALRAAGELLGKGDRLNNKKVFK